MGIYWFQHRYPDLGWKTLIETRSKILTGIFLRVSSHICRCTDRPMQSCQNQNGHFNIILLSCRQEFWSKTLQDDADSLVILRAALVTLPCNSMKRSAGNAFPFSPGFSNVKGRKSWRPWLPVPGGPKTLYFYLGFEPFPLYNANSCECSPLWEEQGVWKLVLKVLRLSIAAIWPSFLE